MKTLLPLIPLALLLFTGCGGDDPVDPEPDTGVVVVQVDPAVLDAGWTLEGPGDYVHAGIGAERLAERATGDYTVTWDDVVNWFDPDPETLTLTGGDSIVFTGSYVYNSQTEGTVVIDPNPDALNAGWVLKLVAAGGVHDRAGHGDQPGLTLPVGPLTIDWEPIPGWATPAGYEDAVLEGGAVVTFTTTYTLLPPWPGAYVDVPAGAFAMGSPASEPGAGGEEWPRHAVTLTRAFAAGETEVTVAQWDAVMDGSGDYLPEEANLPKIFVSWYDAVDYCNALSVLDGLTPAYTVDGVDVTWNQASYGWRLPTEAEWEYLCRAGTVTALSAGELQELGCVVDPVLSYYGWTCANAGSARQPVRSLYPNDWGFYDVHGNVGEWCWDVYDDAYYNLSPATDPTGPVAGSRRVARGGNYTASSQISRSAARTGYNPATLNPAIGFRVVRTLEPARAGAR